MKFAFIFFLGLFSSSSIAQSSGSDSTVVSEKRAVLGGLVAYYFWEEDSLGKIVGGTINKPYRRNEIVVINAPLKSKEKLSNERISLAVSGMSHVNNKVEKRFFSTHPNKDESDLIYIPLRKREATEMSTVQFRQRSGTWESFTRKNVVYFNVYTDSSKSYSHSNDSINLSLFNVKRKAYGHYMVKTFWDENEAIVDQQVYAYNGQDVTSYFRSDVVEVPKRVVIFSNGYRGRKRNKDVSDNLITQRDRYYYWMKLDKLFLNRLEPDDHYYIDGSHDVNTSNHRSKANFGVSYSRVKALKKKPENANEYQLLNTKPNKEGFQLRREKGIIAAKAYQAIRCSSPGCNEVKDTIDMVCHSMGYAYALGFLEALEGQIVLGKIYIIAPDNACSGGMDWTQFEEVWQYGSNLDQADSDPVWEQDGIAPQCEVKDLVSANIGGRVFLPSYIRKKDFVKSHMLKQYHWIIKKLEEGEAGYVH